MLAGSETRPRENWPVLEGSETRPGKNETALEKN